MNGANEIFHVSFMKYFSLFLRSLGRVVRAIKLPGSTLQPQIIEQLPGFPSLGQRTRCVCYEQRSLVEEFYRYRSIKVDDDDDDDLYCTEQNPRLEVGSREEILTKLFDAQLKFQLRDLTISGLMAAYHKE